MSIRGWLFISPFWSVGNGSLKQILFQAELVFEPGFKVKRLAALAFRVPMLWKGDEKPDPDHEKPERTRKVGVGVRPQHPGVDCSSR